MVDLYTYDLSTKPVSLRLYTVFGGGNAVAPEGLSLQVFCFWFVRGTLTAISHEQ